MTHRVFRSGVLLILTAVLLAWTPSAAAAQTQTQSRRSSTAKRVVWTVVGAAAGFGVGAWFGLHKFDDAVNSDRKVWTSAIVGAAAGGIAGGLLSRNVRPGPTFPASRIERPKLLHGTAKLVKEVEDEYRPLLRPGDIGWPRHRDPVSIWMDIERADRPGGHN